MADEDDEKTPLAGDPSEDVRFLFFEEYILRAMKLKGDKWAKLINVDENAALIFTFFDNAEQEKLLFTLNAGGMLQVSLDWPLATKSKTLFYLKRNKATRVTKDNYKTAFIYGDLSLVPLDQLNSFVDDIVLPLMGNDKNHDAWPKVISEDLVRHCYGMKNKVHVVNGLTKGTTLLPMPAGTERMEEFEAEDRQVVHAIEGIIIEWTHQIRDILKTDSSAPLLADMNPNPFVETKFWDEKAKNLANIYDQLREKKVRRMMETLREIDSSYYHAFKRIFRDTVAALSEAQDISLHLKPLKRHFEDVEGTEFNECRPLMEPMMKVVALIWVHSKYYRAPHRLIVLLQEINNLFIEVCRLFLDPFEVFHTEPEEATGRIKECIDNLKYWKELFFKYKEEIKGMFKEDAQAEGWDFPPSLVFNRFDGFTERIEVVLYLYETAIEFSKLEKVEIGGLKGKMLTANVFQIFEEFNECFKIFTENTYDNLDYQLPAFHNDFDRFNTRVNELDRRLGDIVCQAFDDCINIESAFKLIDVFGGLLDRELIKKDFEPKLPDIVEKFHEELDRAKTVYDEQMKMVEVHKNLPNVAGQLKFCQELRQRLERPHSFFENRTNPVFESDRAKEMEDKYEEMMQLLSQYEKDTYDAWVAKVDRETDFNLNKPVLLRDEQTRHISVNIDPQLISVLREVKYLKILGREDIPDKSLNFYEETDKYIKYLQNLDVTVKWYNKILDTQESHEQPLIEDELATIDAQLKKAENDLTWTAPGLWEYIEQTRDMIHDLEKRLQKSKDNIADILKIMSVWAKSPLFERKEGKLDSLLDIQGRENALKSKADLITQDGEKIHALVAENKALLKVHNDQGPDWMAYVDVVDAKVVKGFFDCVNTSLDYFLDNLDSGKNIAVLFEIQLELTRQEMLFKPSLDNEVESEAASSVNPKTFYELIESLLNDVFSLTKLIKRLSMTNEQDDYFAQITNEDELIEKRQEIDDKVQGGANKAIEYRSSFESLAYLWTDDRKEFMEQFVRYGHVLTPEEIEQYAETEVPETPPTLEQFKEQIDGYEKTYSEIESMSSSMVFDNWLRIDSKPFKQALLNEIKKWSYMLKQHLIDNVTNSLEDLKDFISYANAGLGKQIPEGDYHGLVECMAYLLKVKERQATTDTMFEPIKEQIELLESYGQEMSDEVHQRLEELPEQWNNTKKIAFTVKQNVAPLQADEVANIRRKCTSFEVRQHEFREIYRQTAPFAYDTADPYEQLDEQHIKIFEMEEEMAALYKSAGLFEVNVPEYRQLRQCRKETRMLKNCWDLKFLITSSFEEWNSTRWTEINVESMDMECKKFAKEIRSLDKECRAWDVYTGMENAVKNLMTSLRAVGELQNPAIRDRHWNELMQATGVKIVMSSDTTFLDLLNLNLHNFEEEVKGIVDKSVKEGSMEKVLRELDRTWSAMEFEYEKHPRTEVPLIKASEELIETLEDNQVQLQNMMSSKYIAHFLEEVSDWTKKLSTADSVIQIFVGVQKTWSYLESIFIGSEDIRRQLPDDSVRFDGIDQDFKEILYDTEKTPNVVEATNKEGLYDRLEVLQSGLALCEKALAEYLETKRLAFPRFYFVSSADLLNILSNGNYPEKVAPHLSKLFDSLCNLEFADAGKKSAKTMFANDGEQVDLDEHCDCSGQVEDWLNRVQDRMQETVRKQIGDATAAYEDQPREQWLFDWPAQAALATCQIWWVTEVGYAFAKLEEGYENAMKDYNKKQVSNLNALIMLLIGNLTKGDRQKIMTICTINVHERDVILKLITNKIDNSQAFLWLSQLRHRWDEDQKHCFANICDAQFRYSYEYLGNTPRLVITPLTDRCYITLTQSLHLIMGGAPAGPAGTGKTETTKDLGKALGIMVYVFNCSEQMDYKSCGNIYKGLAQAGAWGCFDEFNRISVEVLSVIAVQVKSVLDAIKDKKDMFDFMGEGLIKLKPTVGMWITMNPGYAGRAELPENLKALFRPCAMVVPDFALISEIMLVAEAFTEAKLLARRFITLYTLCKELLSKQDHYDWGLRAIKSVLVVAGSLRRGDPNRPEDQVLMRALRDFNVPKIVTDDMPVFLGLIGDLFPAMNVPRKRDEEFEKIIKKTATDLKLQTEDSFVLKVVQLQELIEVRHSVFVLGNAGTGKSEVLRCLHNVYKSQKKKAVFVDLNPKAVTNDELFGIINPATREWKDGLFSVIMRDMANIAGDAPKWIVLDGDIDPMWIESLNTVMDDNKVLTLASNERIPLNPTMRLMFEIAHLKTATPATVSRAGILYVNPQDLGWNPMVQSWIDTREIQTERANLTILFDKYIPPCLETMRTRFKKITPITEASHIMMLCYLLEAMLTPQNTPPDCPKDQYELYFVFCCVWAFGACMFQDQLVDYRVEFTKWWQNDFKTIKFPSQGTVFDYFIDTETKKFEPWTKLLEKFEYDPDLPLSAMLVNTSETVRIRYFMDIFIDKRKPIMLVGNAGSGKTVLINNKLNSLSSDQYVIANAPFNFYTTSEMLQRVLEKPLEKKAGRNYGPPGTKKLIYFIDDMNMPEVDKYFTVQPHTLLRQHMDYQHWYDRVKLSLKDINNVQYVSCMNPTAGSFTINPRLQRHFSVFAISFPNNEAIVTIYNSVLSQHLQMFSFQPPIQKLSSNVVNATLAFHQRIAQVFLPTAIRFHYNFNLRDLTNVFQGLLFSTPECVKTPMDFCRLWIHECRRVYRDKLIDAPDMENYDKVEVDMVQKGWEELNLDEAMHSPVLYTHFSQGMGDPKYLPLTEWSQLNKLLVEALEGYNEMNAQMNLVLFEDAMSHVARINRILEAPRGNALLVGVGGSGKQSLARLSAFISSLEVFQVTLRKGYSVTDLKTDLAALYIKAGVKNVGTVFLMTDSQVADERFLVLINDLLASGEIPEILPDDEVENVIGAMRPEVKGMGMEDSRENCWKFFIDKVRRNLKLVLCFSPVGATIRIRARRFPAIVNCTSIDWFHEWPKEALVSVSMRFLSEVELLGPDLRESIAEFMSYVHISVNDMSQVYLQNERRYYYTTPKSFLELIMLYRNLLGKQHKELLAKMERLENGLQKLQSTSSQVDDLKEKLKSQEVELAQKNEDADKLIEVVGKETEIVNAEKEKAAEEEAKVTVIKREVSIKQSSCEEDLQKAEPALQAAQEALNTLDKNNLTELKSFGSPPAAVVNVTAGVMVLYFGGAAGKVPKDRSWKAAKTMMGNVGEFLNNLITFDKDHIHANAVKAMDEYMKNPEFDPEFIKAKSSAAAGLCSWAINIIRYFEVYCEVEPKRLALEAANKDLASAQAKLDIVQAKIAELDANLGKLTAEFEAATAAKLKCQQEAEATENTIKLANRLVGGLASENVRWAESVKKFKQEEVTLPGDVLLISAFISYVGGFTKRYRLDLTDNLWRDKLKNLKTPIPTTENLDPLAMVTDNAQIAAWNNEGLPSDRMSTENATILTSCERWPLMIDPQLQGIKWIKTKYGENLTVIRLGQKGYLDTMERALANGETVLVENLGEEIEAVLDPILGRNTIKKGTAIKLGDKEIEYNQSFRLILHTKLANPHYKPEIQAQATLINFTVTRDGLEDQLLADVVSAERPDLEELRLDLTKKQNEFTITLKQLEDNLLARLSAAGGNFLGDTALVENLETTKRTASEIEVQVAEAKVTEVKINEARELYRPAANRASILYFILNEMDKINPIYQFSLKAFNSVFRVAIERAAPPESEDENERIKQRVRNLIDQITYQVYIYTTRGLFEKDKLIFTTQVAFQILLNAKEIQAAELDFLLRFPLTPNATSPVDFLNNNSWGAIKSLSAMEEFKNLDKDLEGSAKRWKKFVESEAIEKEKFPQEWKNKTSLQRLCMLRALRPDRMTYAVTMFIEERLGKKYTENRAIPFAESYKESGPAIPVFFILSPGVDPLVDVEALGKKIGFTFDSKNFHNVSLGQGQEIVAENAIELASKEGHWVILQNVHLVAKWLPTLEKKMEEASASAHEAYRIYISAEPAPSPESHILPQGILENSIKITNEPPTGMFANLHKALDNFDQDTLEMCSKEAEFKSILFSLCYFHAVIAERRKFGPQGWNRGYPFNTGDLKISAMVLYNYLENNAKVPWEDLRYLFGEIMYGGHITDDWDRRLCRTFLEEFMGPDQVPVNFPLILVISPVQMHNMVVFMWIFCCFSC
ncbi:dynein beta chain, ciliary-like isoform X2 [Convolutriloba macropyga]|uniref:dynein beta chain, ciliary-like isoform X2 n=1 Tax=Convolutriloba macropyga TaxID=536237 RepID=UPI003F521961